MKKVKGKDLIFISRIMRQGTGVADVENPLLLDNVQFELRPLSLTFETYIASEFNTYVVKLRK
jgi:hypothetical protein